MRHNFTSWSISFFFLLLFISFPQNVFAGDKITAAANGMSRDARFSRSITQWTHSNHYVMVLGQLTETIQKQLL